MWCKVINRQCPFSPVNYKGCEEYCITDEAEEIADEKSKNVDSNKECVSGNWREDSLS